MKKSIKTIFAAGLIILAASCSKEQFSSPVIADGLVRKQFTAELSETKAALDGNKVVWSEGDEIAVFDGTQVNKFTLVAGAGTSSGTFTGTVTEYSTKFQAVSPYTAYGSVDKDTISVKLPSKQVIPAGKNADPSALVQVAVTTGSNLAFKNVTSRVKFTIAMETVKSISFQGKAEETFTGTGRVEFGKAIPTTLSATGTILTVQPESGAFAAGDYYAFILPANFTTGFAITADNTDNVLVRTTENEQVFERNAGKNLGDFLDGADEMPMTITSMADLETFAQQASLYPPTATVTLETDLSVGETTILPIDLYCNFDGKNHAIGNFQLSGNGNLGVFDNVKGTVSNIVFGSLNGTEYDGVSSIIYDDKEGLTAGRFIAAPICYITEGNIINVKNYAPVTVNANGTRVPYAAGILGNSNCTTGTIENCINYAAITGLNPAADWLDLGGIAGQVVGLTVKNCENHGKILFNGTGLAKSLNMGGISGGSNISTYQNCKNYGVVEIGSAATITGASNIGGITGYNVNGLMNLDGCVNEVGGDVIIAGKSIKNANVGGVAGNINFIGSVIKNCTNKAKVTSMPTAVVASASVNYGGIVGYVTQSKSATIDHCVNEGAISNTYAISGNLSFYTQLGGIIGANKGTCTVTSNTNKGTVTNSGKQANIALGGIVGEDAICTNNIFKDNVNEGNISNTADITARNCVAGIAGRLTFANTYENCDNKGNVSSANVETGYSLVAGCVADLAAACTIVKCDNEGSVSITGKNAVGKDKFVGGVVSKTSNKVTIKECTNSGEITQASTGEGSQYIYTGGVVATLHSGSTGSSVVDCVNNGTVVNKTKTTHASGFRLGGVCGASIGTISFEGCVNNGEVRDESASTNSHTGGVLGYCSGTVNLSKCECSSTAVIKSTGNHEVLKIAGVIGAIGGANSTFSECKSNATLVSTGTVKTTSAYQIVGNKDTYDSKSITNCGVGGVVLGTTVTAENYTQYVNGDACTPEGTYFLN